MNVSIPQLVGDLEKACGRVRRTIRIMEVCGTHTVSIFRTGLKSMLPANLRLISGPGCPVCVTAQRHIDAAIRLASRPGVIIATYGDMLRVPGSLGSLELQRARGSDVRVIYSAVDAVELARATPEAQVVFLGIGFETTAPATAAAVLHAAELGLHNFSVLAVHKLVVPAMMALLQEGDVPIDAFLCPGHVSVILGADAYRPVVDQYGLPCVVAGFEPPNMLLALLHIARQVRDGRAELENVYRVAVAAQGNQHAKQLLDDVFTVERASWRGLGDIPESGLGFRPEYRRFDALDRFKVALGDDHEPPGCLCAEVIQGKVDPPNCPMFATDCTPMRPIGPCMVSSEGTCAAWFKYRQIPQRQNQTMPAAMNITGGTT